MTRQGKLTNTEKYAIQGMSHIGKTLEEICDELNRPQHVVKKYIDGELASIHETIAKVQLQQNPPPVENPENKPIKSKDLFIRQTVEKKEKGVTISTEATSSRGDLASKKNTVVSRHANKNLYRISDGKVLEQGDKIKE